MVNESNNKVRFIKITIHICTFCFLFFLFFNLPLISDDFEFADLVRNNNIGEVANYILYYGNGRVLGNTLSIILVNINPLISALVKAATVCGIISLLPRVLGLYSVKTFIISFLLIIGTAPQIFAQVFNWTSGFVNFTFSVFLSLLCIFIIQTTHQPSFFRRCVLVSLGILGQLFVEHVSILNIILSLGIFIYYYKKDKIKKDVALTWLCGCIVGSIILIVFPYIFYIDANRTQGYRKVHIDSISSIIQSITGSVQLMLVTLSRCTLWFISISYFGWFTSRTLQNKTYAVLAKGVYLLFPIISFLFNINNGVWIPPIIRYVIVYGGLIVYCLVLVIDILTIFDKQNKTILLLLLMLGILSAAPFLIVTPFGERCLFLSYLFFVSISLKNVDITVSTKPLNSLIFKWVLLVLTITLSVVLFIEIANIKKWDSERNSFIETCMKNGENSITIYEIPSPYSMNTYLIGRYYYYETWHDISFDIIEYEQWRVQEQNE